jgi:uncharacterized protein (DUF4213/DUF364 family)
MAYSESLLEAAIGMATINSLLEVDEERCLALNGGDLIARKGKGKRVAIVGHFPFIAKLREIAKELWVIEKNPQHRLRLLASPVLLSPIILLSTCWGYAILKPM